MKSNSKHTGTLTLSNGNNVDYELLPLTFQNYKEKGAMLVEFWQEPNKSYLTGIGPKSCPPIHSKFRFLQSIYRI